MSAIKPNLKFFGASLLTCLIILAGFNQFLKTDLYLRWLASINGSSYFYLTYDWQKKFLFVEKSKNEGPVIFLGSSRTSNSINPQELSTKAYNLGLVAGSYNEIEQLSSFINQNHTKKYKAIFLELNPMSATDRHLKAMGNNENKEMLKRFLEPHKMEKLLIPFMNNQIYLQRYILNDFFKDLFKAQPFPDDSSKFKRAFHTEEFRNILNDDYLGYTPATKIEDRYTQDFFNNCSTMTSWSFNNSSESFRGLTVFKKIIQNLKKNTDHLILWIPPLPKDHHFSDNEIKISNALKEIGKEEGLKIVDLSSFSNDSNAFYDCIHLKKESSSPLAKALLKSGINE